MFSSNNSDGTTTLTTFSIRSLCIWSLVASGACCVEITLVSTLTGLSSSYSMVTCVFPSGLKYANPLFFLTSASFFASFCAKVIGSGKYSS